MLWQQREEGNRFRVAKTIKACQNRDIPLREQEGKDESKTEFVAWMLLVYICMYQSTRFCVSILINDLVKLKKVQLHLRHR